MFVFFLFFAFLVKSFSTVYFVVFTVLPFVVNKSLSKLTREDVDERGRELVGEDGLRQFTVIALDDVRQTVDVRVLVKFRRRRPTCCC